MTPVATIFGIPGTGGIGITSTNGAFKRILQTGVGPGSWIVIATVNNVGVGLLEETRRSFRMACELREGNNGENFIGGNVFTESATANSGRRADPDDHRRNGGASGTAHCSLAGSLTARTGQ